jgi:hypothetical protein
VWLLWRRNSIGQMATPSPEELDAFHRIHNGPRDTRVALVLAVEIPIVILVVSTVCLRFYARTFIKRTLGKDDWIMALSAVCVLLVRNFSNNDYIC